MYTVHFGILSYEDFNILEAIKLREVFTNKTCISLMIKNYHLPRTVVSMFIQDETGMP